MTGTRAGRWGRLVAALAAAWALAAAPRAGAQSIPSGGTALVNGDVATAGSFYANTNGDGPVATRTLVDVTGQAFARAARVATLRPTGDFWSSAINQGTNRAVADGDVVLLHFFMRAIETTDESGQAVCQVYVEGPAPNYLKSISTQVAAGLEWVEFFIPFEVDGDYASGQLGVKFGFGASVRPQILELGGVEVLWYGKSRPLAEMPRTAMTYAGREAWAPWRIAAAARIDQHRKADYAVRVVNTAGAAVPGATVRVRQRRHAFEFGNAFDGYRIVNQTNPDNATYRQKIVELFNAGSFGNDLKWQPWLGEWGSNYTHAIALGALQWARDNGIAMRGHVLVWPSTRNMPNSLTAKINASDPTIPATILAHIDDIVTTTRDWLVEWDVLNEPYDNHDIMDRYGNVQMIEWFKRARANHPTAELYINDYAILSGGGVNVPKQDAYEATIRYIRDGGGPLTGVGFQGHFSGAGTGIPRVWEIMQRYATAFPDVKFRITEYDYVTEDEQLQADFLRDFYTIAFSHPQMAGIQMWGFWEGAHWRSEAAMYRRDWTEKPVGAAYRQLVFGDWWTDVTTKASATGRVAGRGFRGNYTVEASFGGITTAQDFTLASAGAQLTLTLNVPTGAPAVTVQPVGATVVPGGTANLAVTATGAGPLGYQWRRNGVDLPGATGAALALANVQPADAGVYTVAVTGAGGLTVSDGATVAVLATAKATGAGTEVGVNIVHPNGNIYDQVLMTGPAVTITADPGQVTRTSYVDLTDDIVQVEFAGAGSLTIALAGATGPAAPAYYNQDGVAYMKGHATLTIAGADETTNVSVFTVGRNTAVNQALFRADVGYDGVADIALMSIRSVNGRFGGVRCANAEFFATGGQTGVYAPGVDFAGPFYLHNVAAADDADPVLVTGAIGTGRIGITGGDMKQPNARPVRVAGAAMIEMRAGQDSHGNPQPAQANRASYERDGLDVTGTLVVNP